jgi:hypothetical protein
MAIGSDPVSLATSPSKLVDGNTATYFQSSKTTGAWAGLDLGGGHTITGIQFAPRNGGTYAAQMIGGKFQVSNTADFSSGVVDVYTIKAAPKSGKLTRFISRRRRVRSATFAISRPRDRPGTSRK